MSLDPSLKSASALVRHRNVLTRDERIVRLQEAEKWSDGRSVFGLPKVANRKQVVGGKGDKEEATDAAGAAAGAAGAAPAAATAPAKGAAAPAKGKTEAKPGAAAGAAAAPSKGKK
jgi:small basic protein (TIGR04137 family)